MTRNIKLLLEYQGTSFHGWQKQPALRTVQGELEAALATILQTQTTTYAAGRTDAGVHALGQVVNFRTDSEIELGALRKGLNALTGEDLTISDAALVPEEFHARHSAHARHYAYLLLHAPSALWGFRALWLKRPLDLAAMNDAVADLVGQHDFAAFSCHSPEEKGTDSHLFYAHWEPWARGLILRVGAVRFLYHMVRCIVGLSLEVGRGRLPAATFRERLAAPAGRGEIVAPARGLHLVAVDYAETSWGPDCLPPGPVL